MEEECLIKNSITMFKSIGKTFKHKGVKLRVIEVDDVDECTGCYFEYMQPCGIALGYLCVAQLRKDRKNVIFAEVD